MEPPGGARAVPDFARPRDQRRIPALRRIRRSGARVLEERPRLAAAPLRSLDRAAARRAGDARELERGTGVLRLRRPPHLRAVTVLRSRDNPRVKRWARLAADGRYRKKERRALIEGPRLVAALLDQGLRPLALLVTEDALRNAEIKALVRRTKLEP